MENNDHVALLHKFSIEKKPYSLQSISQGLINDTFLVLDVSRPIFILQSVNTTVFQNVAGLMNNFGKALDYLADADYAKIELVKTLDGDYYYETSAGECWRLMTYIDHSTAYNTTTNPIIAYEAGRVIGKFHQLLHTAPIKDFEETIPNFHNLQLREDQFKTALDNCPSELKVSAEKAIDFTFGILAKLKEWDQEEIPVRLCHNDTKLNNILFSKHTDKALCLIDLDTLMKGYFHYDFGDAVRTVVNTAPEDEKEHHKITFDKPLFEAFVDGLSSNPAFLTAKEIDLLSMGVVLMPFLHGIRALTDYLNGNIYYKVAYENQNMDRALSLYNFTQKALDQVPYMNEVVKEKLMN
ncbi:aminoglycoside phosphotransferase family protein [Muriicola sp. Z0-33]|nr:aminoglycoside phosphotransferase family protein [Muriicola sp. Z0-33]